jgi:hypothetical protein
MMIKGKSIHQIQCCMAVPSEDSANGVNVDIPMKFNHRATNSAIPAEKSEKSVTKRESFIALESSLTPEGE